MVRGESFRFFSSRKNHHFLVRYLHENITPFIAFNLLIKERVCETENIREDTRAPIKTWVVLFHLRKKAYDCFLRCFFMCSPAAYSA